MTPTQKTVIDTFYAAATDQDAVALRSTLTDVFSFTGPIGDFADPDSYVGHVVSFQGAVSGSRFVTEGDTVVHMCIFEMAGPTPAQIPMCDIFTFRGDRIAKQELFTDTAQFPG